MTSLTAEEIYRQLVELDEHPRLEAKSCAQGLGNSILETVCAFSNEPGMGGGYILLGVQRVPKSLFENTFEIIDLPHADKLQLDLVTRCAEAFNHRVWPQINPEILHNKRVLTVYVPELPASQKPLQFKNIPMPQAAFRRSGSADVRCRDEDIDIFYQDRKRESFDENIVDGASLADIDPQMIALYRELRKVDHPDAEELLLPDSELLLALGCAKPKGTELCPTVAGVLLFGTTVAIRRWFPLMRIDYLRVPGRKWMKDPDKRYASLEIRGPLIRAIQRAMAAILDDVTRDFTLAEGALHRKDVPPIPDKVIREVVVNAVMHRCYSVQSPIQIIRFANRLEIRNPGYSLKAPELYGQPGSQNRNPKIAAVLHELNIAETKGTGIRVMQRKMRDANLSPPYLGSDRHANSFVAVLVLQHFMRPEVIDWLANFKDLALTDEEAHALFFVREIGAINSIAYCMLSDADPVAACTSLHRLCKAVLLAPKFSDGHRWYAPTKYLLNPQDFTARARQKLAQSGRIPLRDLEIPAQGGELTAQSGESQFQSVESGDESVESSPKSVESGGSETDDYGDFAAIPEEVAARLPRVGSRSPRAVMEVAILVLCEWRPLYPMEIASYLKRKSAPRLVADYISPMVAEGLLERTIPSKPNHPAQKYKIAPQGSQRLIQELLG
jgi:ATP-dependent DNA helicase RecG